MDSLLTVTSRALVSAHAPCAWAETIVMWVTNIPLTASADADIHRVASCGMMFGMFRIAFLAPQIGPNAGNVIRTAAVTGCEFHLIKPLGFDMSDRQLRRAGLDYHDLAMVTVHDDFEAAYAAWDHPRIYAFSAHGARSSYEIAYQQGDVLLFGSEHDGLPAPILSDPRITDVVRIPMLPARRSLNLSNAAAIVVYEAWRQHHFAGAQTTGR